MPETIRAANERLRSRPRRGGFLAAFVIATSFMAACATPVRADISVLGGVEQTLAALSQHDTGAVALTLGLVIFGLLAIMVLLRTRRRAASAETISRDEAMELRSEIDRLKALMLSEPQVLVEWAAGSDEPDIVGDTSIFVTGEQSERVLAFGGWLEPASAQRMDSAVDMLRNEGRGFVATVTTGDGKPVEAEGRAIGGRAVLRLRNIGGIEQELVEMTARHDRLAGDIATMTAVLDSLPAPVWARNADNRLIFVNAAYARAVDAGSSAEVVARSRSSSDRARTGHAAARRQRR